MRIGWFAAAVVILSLSAQSQVAAGIHIADVHFTGDTHLKHVDLARCAHDVKTGRFAGPQWNDQLAEFVKNICLQENGYFTARVTPTTKQLGDSDGTHNFNVILNIAAGPQYRTADVTFKGNHAIPSSELRALFPMKQGALFRTSSIREGLALMAKTYRARGYPNFVPVPEFDFDKAKSLITLIVDVDEGKPSK